MACGVAVTPLAVSASTALAATPLPWSAFDRRETQPTLTTSGSFAELEQGQEKPLLEAYAGLSWQITPRPPGNVARTALVHSARSKFTAAFAHTALTSVHPVEPLLR